MSKASLKEIIKFTIYALMSLPMMIGIYFSQVYAFYQNQNWSYGMVIRNKKLSSI